MQNLKIFISVFTLTMFLVQLSCGTDSKKAHTEVKKFQPNGKIVSGGISNGEFTLLRYYSNGRICLRAQP